VRQKFTSKERDNETGLDYFIHRYYSSAQGRFISADPDNAGGDVKRPQSWNGYAYVDNTPLTSTDPLGLWKQVDCTSGNGKCWEAEKGDSIGSLAKLLNVSSKKLNAFFQKPGVESGQVYDVSGFGRGNIPTSRDQGPTFVQVFLVSQPVDASAEFRRKANNILRILSGNLENCHCQAGIFYPGGFGPLEELGAIRFTGTPGVTMSHGARHLLEIGMSPEVVENAIIQDVRGIQATASRTGQFWSEVEVNGHKFRYRAYTQADGKTNIGTYYEVPK